MRRFLLERVEDSSGVSGTGWVAEGIQFTNGIVALTWRVISGKPVAIGDWSSTAVYPHLARCKEVHGHGGKTLFRFIDETDPPHELWCPAIIAGGCGCQCGLGLKETDEWFDCPECGPHVAVDEDGCCVSCGADSKHVRKQPARATARNRRQDA